MEINSIINGDALSVLKTLPNESVDSCVTSPPYWSLRDYNVAGQLGLEPTYQEYITKLCDIFDEVKRVLKPQGTCWVVIGDTYSAQRWTGKGEGQPINKMLDGHRDINPQRVTGLPSKCLVQIPARFAIEMCNRGWILRNELIWHKPRCMPSSAKDRFTVDFEKVFFFSKSTDYYFETQYEPLAEATIKRLKHPWRSLKDSKLDKKVIGMTPESFNRAAIKLLENPRRIKRAVWRVCPTSYREAHFAVYPEELIETPIKAGCPVGGIVMDIFMGAGTTGVVALKNNRNFIGIELNKDYIQIANKRIAKVSKEVNRGCHNIKFVNETLSFFE